MTVTLSGAGAYARRWNINMERREKARLGRRDMGNGKLVNESSQFEAEEVVNHRFKLPSVAEKFLGPVLEKFYTSAFYQQYLLPFLILLHQFIVAALSLSIRTVISRVFIVLCFFLFYFLGLLQPGQNGHVAMVDSVVQGTAMESTVAENLTMLVQN